MGQISPAILNLIDQERSKPHVDRTIWDEYFVDERRVVRGIDEQPFKKCKDVLENLLPVVS